MVIIRSPPAAKRSILRPATALSDVAPPFEWAPLGSSGPSSSRSSQRFPALPATALPLPSKSTSSPAAPTVNSDEALVPAHLPPDNGVPDRPSAVQPTAFARHVDNRPLPTLAHSQQQQQKPSPSEQEQQEQHPPPPLRHIDPRPLPTQVRSPSEQSRLPSLGSIAAMNRAQDPVHDWHERASSPDKRKPSLLPAPPSSSRGRSQSSSVTPSMGRTLTRNTPSGSSSSKAANERTHQSPPTAPRMEITPTPPATTDPDPAEDTSIVIHPAEQQDPSPAPPPPNSKSAPQSAAAAAATSRSVTSHATVPPSSARRTPGTAAHRLDPASRTARMEAHELSELRRRVQSLEKDKSDLIYARNQLKDDRDGWESEVVRLESELTSSVTSQRQSRAQHAIALSASRMATAHSNIKVIAAINDAREADIARVVAENRASYTQARMDELYILREQERVEAEESIARVKSQARTIVWDERAKMKQSTASIQAQEQQELTELQEQVESLTNQLDRAQREESRWQRKTEQQEKKLDGLQAQLQKFKADAKASQPIKPAYHDPQGPRFVDTTSSPARPLDWRHRPLSNSMEEEQLEEAVEPEPAPEYPPQRKTTRARAAAPRVAPKPAAKASKGKKRPLKEPGDEEDEEKEEEPATRLTRKPTTNSKPAPKPAASRVAPTKQRGNGPTATERAAEALALEAEKSVVYPRAMRNREPPPPQPEQPQPRPQPNTDQVSPAPESDEPQAVPHLPGRKKKRRLLGGAGALGSQFKSSDSNGTSLLNLDLSPVKPTRGKGNSDSLFG